MNYKVLKSRAPTITCHFLNPFTIMIGQNNRAIFFLLYIIKSNNATFHKLIINLPNSIIHI